MSKLVLITGLQRGTPNRYNLTTASGIFTGGSDGPASVHGFRVKSAIGRHFAKDATAVKASVTTNSVTYTATYPGTYGNGITVSVSTTYSGTATSVSGTVLETSSTDWTAAGTPVFTVRANPGITNGQLVTFINSDEQISQWISASTSSAGTAIVAFQSVLGAGTNGVNTADAEPPYGVNGEPIWINVNDQVTVVVDIQDRVVQRTLQRNRWRYISLGGIEAVTIR